MVIRRILVIDNQPELDNLVESAFNPHGYETQRVGLEEDSLLKIKTIRPSIVFVNAKGPDKSVLSFCNRAKRNAGSSIPVVVVHSSFPKSDIELHGKQRYHGDLYLEESDLSKENLIEYFRSFIVSRPDDLSSDANQIEFEDFQLISLKRNNTETPTTITGQVDGLNDADGAASDEPSWIKSLFEQVLDDTSSDGTIDSNKQKLSVDKLLHEDWDNYNDLEKRLLDQENEITDLKMQLEEALRQARSSPFSSDYLNLREGSIRKEKEISFLKEQLSTLKQQVAAKDQRLKEIAKRLLISKTELDQARSDEGKLAKRFEESQAELAKLNCAFEEARVNYDSQIERLTHEYSGKLKTSEEEHTEIIKSLKQQLSEVRNKIEVAKQSELNEELSIEKRKHQQQIDGLQKEYNEVIETLTKENELFKEKIHTGDEQKITSLKEKHNIFVKEIRKAHKSDVEKLEAEIKEIKKEHQKQLEKKIRQHQKEIRHINEEAKGEKKRIEETLESQYNSRIKSLELEHHDKMVQLEKDYKDKIKTFKSAMSSSQEHLDNELGLLISDHEKELRQSEERHHKTIESLKIEIENEKHNVEKLTQKISLNNENLESVRVEYEKELDNLKINHQKKIDKILGEQERVQEQYFATEKQLRSEIAKLEKNSEKNLKELDKKYKENLQNLDIQYSSQIAELKKKNEGKIQSLENKYMEKISRAEELLADEKKQHEETRINLESKFAKQLMAQSKR